MRELTSVALAGDELEALRLADYLGLHHAQAGAQMGISRATFGRLLAQARKKTADALLNGHAIVLQDCHSSDSTTARAADSEAAATLSTPRSVVTS